METNITESKSFIAGFWERNRFIFKSFLIAVLVLLLLIPTSLIQDLVRERQGRQIEAVTEVASKWANSQTVTGPVVVIPYSIAVKFTDGTVGKETRNLFFLPAKLNIQSEIIPEERHRGIYKVIVYNTNLKLSGSFAEFNIKDLGVPAEEVHWNEAAVFFDVTDVRGLKEEVKLNWQDTTTELIPAKFSNQQFKSSLSGTFPLDANSITSGGNFSMNLTLKGSEDLQFVPVGKETSLKISSAWADPSFKGNYLPDERIVNDSGFTASWKVLYLNRSFPQQWKDGIYDLNSAAFGVNLLVPVDMYQKSTRSIKYAILCIILTFTAFFLIELIYRKPIHALQYSLVGFALCIFYTLLLSISEYIAFNAAYGIAAFATILLISWFVRSILQSGKIALFIASVLAVMYGFMFVLIQSQDYALLMGSIGLFITIALVMYFSRKVRWNQ